MQWEIRREARVDKTHWRAQRSQTVQVWKMRPGPFLYVGLKTSHENPFQWEALVVSRLPQVLSQEGGSQQAPAESCSVQGQVCHMPTVWDRVSVENSNRAQVQQEGPVRTEAQVYSVQLRAVHKGRVGLPYVAAHQRRVLHSHFRVGLFPDRQAAQRAGRTEAWCRQRHL